MNYEDALNYIHSAPKMQKKAGNKSLVSILDILGNPQNKLKFIHIAGTNGKGSVAAMLDSALRYSGIKTGLFTSPFLEVFNERIRSNGKLIPNEKLAYYTEMIKNKMEENNICLYEFAIIFVISLLYFCEEQCEIVILETGLGGRLDATNIIESPLLSIITKIGMDHMQYLGNTLPEITYEKCGIIKNNGTVISYPKQNTEVNDIIKKHCIEKNAHLYIPDSPIKNGNGIIYENEQYLLSLSGEYQNMNAAVAIKALKVLGSMGYNINHTSIYQGLKNTFWPGRFEWLSKKLLIDGCHNEDGANAFVDALKNETGKVNIVTCAMEDKEYSKIAEILSKIADTVIITKIDMPRAVNPEKYADCFRKSGINPLIISDPLTATEKALSFDGICAVCGSLYLVGEIRARYGNKHLY